MNKKLSETLVRNLSGDIDNWKIFQDKVTPQTKKMYVIFQFKRLINKNFPSAAELFRGNNTLLVK